MRFCLFCMLYAEALIFANGGGECFNHCKKVEIQNNMSEERDANVQEFKLEPDCELRFEVESKNEKVTLEVTNMLHRM